MDGWVDGPAGWLRGQKRKSLTSIVNRIIQTHTHSVLSQLDQCSHLFLRQVRLNRWEQLPASIANSKHLVTCCAIRLQRTAGEAYYRVKSEAFNSKGQSWSKSAQPGCAPGLSAAIIKHMRIPWQKLAFVGDVPQQPNCERQNHAKAPECR